MTETAPDAGKYAGSIPSFCYRLLRLPAMNSSPNRQEPRLSPGACALERLPHLATRVQSLWGHAEFERYVNHLVMEVRDGNRQGLPWDLAQELLFLTELSAAKRALSAADLTGAPFGEMFARCLASSANASNTGRTADHWSDARVNNEASRMGRSHGNSRQAFLNDYRHEGDKTWWRRLFA